MFHLRTFWFSIFSNSSFSRKAWSLFIIFMLKFLFPPCQFLASSFQLCTSHHWWKLLNSGEGIRVMELSLSALSLIFLIIKVRTHRYRCILSLSLYLFVSFYIQFYKSIHITLQKRFLIIIQSGENPWFLSTSI